MPTAVELRKALDTSTASGGNTLLPYDLDPVLNEELLKLQPLAELLTVVPAGAKTHEYTIRSSHPQGWFEGESTGANNKNSTYVRKSTMLKIQRQWGSVTGFAQVFDAPFVDALATELTGTVEGMGNLLEFSSMYACADDLGFTGDPYQFSGILPYLAKLAPQNLIDGGSAKVSLDVLDQATAAVSGFRQARTDPKLWFMGLRMKQIVDGLQTRVQIPLTDSELLDGRITMRNYGGFPIFESDYVVPAATTTSPACSAALGGNTTGALTAATYTYAISSVTMTGEQVGGTVSSGMVVDGATDKKVDLTWTKDANALNYMIWRKAGAGAYQLLDIIPALTYNADGSISGSVEAYTDLGSKTPIVAAALRPLAVGEQNILLLNRHADRGVALLGKVDDMGRTVKNMLTYVELARIKDTYDFMVKGYLGLRIKYANTAAAMIRCVKLA